MGCPKATVEMNKSISSKRCVILSFAGNEKGFAMLGNLKTSARNQSPIEKLMLKITTKSQIETRLSEQNPYRITNVYCYSVRPNIAKPHVSGSLFYSSIIHSSV